MTPPPLRPVVHAPRAFLTPPPRWFCSAQARAETACVRIFCFRCSPSAVARFALYAACVAAVLRWSCASALKPRPTPRASAGRRIEACPPQNSGADGGKAKRATADGGESRTKTRTQPAKKKQSGSLRSSSGRERNTPPTPTLDGAGPLQHRRNAMKCKDCQHINTTDRAAAADDVGFCRTLGQYRALDFERSCAEFCSPATKPAAIDPVQWLNDIIHCSRQVCLSGKISPGQTRIPAR